MSTGYRVLHAADAFWRPSNATGVPNTDLAKQLETDALGARLWRLLYPDGLTAEPPELTDPLARGGAATSARRASHCRGLPGD